MMLSKLMEKLPIEALDRIKSYLGIQNGEIVDILKDRTHLELILSKMSILERALLKTIVKHFGPSAFEWSQIHKAASNKLAGAEIRAALHQLRQKGILFTFIKSWGDTLMILPSDTFGIWTELLLGGPARRQETPAEIKPFSRTGSGFSYDLFRFLVYAGKNELKLTKSGTIPKRHIQKLNELLTMPLEPIQGFSFPYTHSDVYDARLAMVLDMALRLDLLESKDDSLKLHPLNLQSWLSTPCAELDRILYQVWREIRFPEAHRTAHLVALLELTPKENWVSLNEAIKWMNASGFVGEEVRENELFSSWVEPLHALGWVELGSSLDGDIWIRPLANSATDETSKAELLHSPFILQPDFEILVPPVTSYEGIWELECAANFIKKDGFAVYRLTKESFTYALERGRTKEQILEFLQENASYGVPETVSKAIQSWGEQFGRIRMEPVVLLECRDVSTAEYLEVADKFKSYLLDKIGERYFTVIPERAAELAELLSKAGISPHMKGQFSAASYPKLTGWEIQDDLMNSEDDGDKQLPKGLIYHSSKVLYYNLESSPPSLEDQYEGWKELPASWLKDARVYHYSTKKELARTAIQYEALLKLNIRGNELIFTPRSIKETGSEWSLMGNAADGKVESLLPGDWDEMKLLLPGLNV